MVLLNKSLRQCQSQPGTAFTPRYQGIENTVFDEVRHARSIVDDMQFQCQAITLLAESDLTRNSGLESDLRISRCNALCQRVGGFVDEQSRVIAVTLNIAESPQGEVRVVNGYFVNGQEPGSEKFAYKMKWLDGLRAALRAELAAHPRLVLLGDFNITVDDRDSYDPVALRETIHHTSEERQHFQGLIELGLTDAFRMFEQLDKSYSWWDYREFGFRRNRGLRIDHILVSEALKPLVKSCVIDKLPRKNERPSDHAPVIVEITS